MIVDEVQNALDTESHIVREYAEITDNNARALKLYANARHSDYRVFLTTEAPLIPWDDDSAKGKQRLEKFLKELQNAGYLRFDSAHNAVAHFTAGASHTPAVRRMVWLHTTVELIALFDECKETRYITTTKYAQLAAAHFERPGGKAFLSGSLHVTKSTSKGNSQVVPSKEYDLARAEFRVILESL